MEIRKLNGKLRTWIGYTEHIEKKQLVVTLSSNMADTFRIIIFRIFENMCAAKCATSTIHSKIAWILINCYLMTE